MFGQYEETNFEAFADFSRQSYERMATKGEDSSEAAQLRNRAQTFLKAAVNVFTKTTTIKPDHLVELQNRLENMGINEETVARYCLQVEAFRAESGREQAAPLIDPHRPSRAHFRMWLRDIQAGSEAWDYDPTHDDRDAVLDVLPLNEAQATAVQAEVFGTLSRSLAFELS